ncbi:MAG: hypothetical protein EXQ55_07630 [Acidobacteria bacterium]|nr:hypothetical protein [Acidobacteriota bacterium]
MRALGILRWIAGGLMFVAVAAVMSQLGSRAAAVPDVNGYMAAASTDQDIQTALQFAVSDQRGKNRSAVKLLSVLAAERQSAAGENVRMCLSLDRRGRTDAARVVVHRNLKNRWSVTLWAWGACGK